MSCRKTKGNSAVTSYTRLVSGADEKTVSREFHAAARAAKHELGRESRTPADPAEVLAHLDRLEGDISASRLPQRHKDSLQTRVNEARHEIANGQGPSRGTFIAWQRVADYVAAVQHAAESTGADEADRVTADEVAEAKAAWLSATESLTSGAGARTALLHRITRLRQKYERLQAAYDLTREGFIELRHAYRARGAADPEIVARWVAARAHQDEPSVAPAEDRRTMQQLAGAVAAAHERLKKMASLYRLHPTANTRLRAEAAQAEYRDARQSYLARLASMLPAGFAKTYMSSASPQTWVACAVPGMPRHDVWSAAELVLAERDLQEFQKGRLDDLELRRRATRRAEARQSVLDAEGHGELDPANQSFAQAVRRRRATTDRTDGGADD